MQAAFGSILKGSEPRIYISPIGPAEQRDVSAFFHSATWRYEHGDFQRGEARIWPGYMAKDEAGHLIGAMGCGLDRPPVASLLYAAVGGRALPSRVVAALLEPYEHDLRQAGATELTFVGLAPWLARSLEKAGFHLRTTVISYERLGWEIPFTGNTRVSVRPAHVADAERLAELDQAAFEPMWRYPAPKHAEMIRRQFYVLIAELESEVVGYQSSEIWGEQGQIVRLAVHPSRQRRGIGTRLLAEAIRFFRSAHVEWVTLNTQADNTASRRLYERFGFVRTGEEVPVLVKSFV